MDDKYTIRSGDRLHSYMLVLLPLHCGAVTTNVNVNILMLVVEWVHKLTTINLSKFSSKPKFVLDVSDDTK